MKLSFIFVLPILLGLTACATHPIALSDATRLSPRYLWRGANPGKLTLLRDSGIWGAGCSMYASVDGYSVATLDSADAVTIYVRPGHHVASISEGGGLCTDQVAEHGFDIAANGALVLRGSIGQGGEIHLSETAYAGADYSMPDREAPVFRPSAEDTAQKAWPKGAVACAVMSPTGDCEKYIYKKKGRAGNSGGR